MIKFVVFDFDGVFTNGHILFDNDGNALKHYNTKDGNGIFRLIKNNLELGVISGWKHNISQKSIIEHFGIKRISLGSDEKLSVIKNWCRDLNFELKNVAYMGDDLNDIEIMKNVGLVGCPNDAVSDVKKITNFISSKNGGNGAIRDFCDYILKIKNRNSKKISCVVPCAKINLINKNTRKFCDSSLLDIKLHILKKLNFNELILSSNDNNIKQYENENIIFDKRNEYLCTNTNSYKDLYKYHLSTIKNEVMFYTTPLTPFLNNSSIDKLVSFWKNNPNYELVIFSKKIKNILENKILDKTHLPLHHAGFIVDIKTFEKYNYNISEIKNIYYIELTELETLIINNNTNFVLAESIYYRQFTSIKLINNYMLNNNFKKTKLLDCTIRDSGYLNNWDWSYNTVKKFVYYMGEIGIEYCEIGFILDENFSENNCGIWRNINKDFSIISRLKKDTNTKTKIAIMFDIGDYEKYNYNYKLIPNQKQTQIDLIRVCCFHQIIEKTKDVILTLNSKGYKLTLNVMYASHLTDSDIIKIKNFVKGLPIEYLYFADSIGGLTGNDISKFFVDLKEIYPIKNGFHNHDNNGTVFNNIQNLLNYNIDIIDTTISGFGKNGGNCPFELVILYCIIKKKYPYNINKLFEFFISIKDIKFNNDEKINLDKIKDILQQFLNIHPSHTNKFKNLELFEYYEAIKLLKNKSKW